MGRSILILREYIMNLFDLNSDKIIYNIDGKDIEMKYSTCYGKVYEKWLVSKCGKVWSVSQKRFLKGSTSSYNSYKSTHTRTGSKRKSRKVLNMSYHMMLDEEDWWGDGSGRKHHSGNQWIRPISAHKLVIDTWKPLYDNPPESIVWEEWEIIRDLPSVYDHVSKTVWIDHIDDNPTNNHVDNLRRVTSWDNNNTRKAKGIQGMRKHFLNTRYNVVKYTNHYKG